MVGCEGSGLRAGLFFYRIGMSSVNKNKYEWNNFKAFLICSAYSVHIQGVLTVTLGARGGAFGCGIAGSIRDGVIDIFH